MTKNMLAGLMAVLMVTVSLSLVTVDSAYAQWCNNPSTPDDDNDGLPDVQEPLFNGDPCDADTDNDGINDGFEAFDLGTMVNNNDSDGDGLQDGHEVNQSFTDPTLADTSGDGLTDLQAINLGLDPLNMDEDNDGLDNGFEFTHGFNMFSAHDDNDSISTFDELEMGLDPMVDDSTSSIAAACQSFSNTIVACNAFVSEGSDQQDLGLDKLSASSELAKSCNRTSGIPHYFLIIALMMLTSVVSRKREIA